MNGCLRFKVKMNTKPLIGLAGAIFAAMTVEFNNRITSITLVDIRGAMGISVDSGYWVNSIYASAMIIGMILSTSWAVIFLCAEFFFCHRTLPCF